ncbi:universal stress protein [Gluconacetobacter sacchari DSM 12717]|uniref:Universal stress protein n=2 Tax=Gluconacetobacter sacchari TaxID=92759 RepID=A0A7W4IGU3_9PROT|nr:universal stress protein [Gluconacetobacter sacchari]MBB2162514.1 universal stress protein [Gluconacetobacter sacchari]GBQ32643.1 universal stress protein [Gluconacetobacter sacchari DSM 12717]
MRILAILDRPETALFTLQAVGELVRRLPARDIRLLHPRRAADPAFQAPDEGIPTPARRAAFARRGALRAERLRASAQAWIGPAGEKGVATAHWAEMAGDVRAIVAREAAMADLVVVSRPRAADDEREREDVEQALAGALYDARALVLIAPLHSCATVGARPIIAWHPSPALDRAVAAAGPLLDAAGHVTFLIGADDDAEQPPPERARELTARGAAVTIARFSAPRGRLGEEIRARALAAGGDLLIMGAYTHARFVEWLFGGPTRDLLAHGTLPILTCHHGIEDPAA